MTLGADDLKQLVQPPREGAAGCACAQLVCPGWESISVPPGEPMLEALGTVRPEGDDEPTLEEFHPDGTHYWSPAAPIAVAFHPYNRCALWRCRACGRGFLQYTEYGGYYVDHRIRAVDPARVV